MVKFGGNSGYVPEAKEVVDYIRLDQFLKFSGLAQTGGEAKMIILEGEISVNGEPEARRGRKLRKGDVVQFREEKVRIESVIPSLQFVEA